jgi:fructose-1-phosphate kinase PfkB-like protein
MARDQGVLPVVDAKGPLLVEALKARPALVKPNRSELAATVGSELVEDRDLVEAMRSLAARGAERVVVTDGPKATFAFDGVTVWRVPSPVVEAVNPIGSGDAFTAALVWSLLRGDDLGQASCFAAAAGAANALTLMAGELDLAEFQKLARTIQPSRLENF